MRPSVQQGRSLLAQNFVPNGSIREGARSFHGASRAKDRQQPWTCLQCSAQSRLPKPITTGLRPRDTLARQWQRHWTASAIRRVGDRPSSSDQPPTTSTSSLQRESQASFARADLAAQAAESLDDLPSHRERQRWHLSKRTQSIMDDLMAQAAIATQRLNNYTGTDYSVIEALRQAIIEQERAVRSSHAAVASAKEAYTSAHTQQASSQKEVVGLLERKQSWAAADLERYMSLIRSEHLNEQAVQAAKDALADAERTLEDARSELEKKERKQYHEEQIWSDTIRRNSTWVTFGLMGVNILLLLSSLAIIEPWRRRRLVREVRAALEEKSFAAMPAPVLEEVNQSIEPTATPTVIIGEPAAAEPSVVEPTTPILESEETVGAIPLASGEILPQEAVDVVPDTTPPPQVAAEGFVAKAPPGSWEHYKELFQDLFSERQMTLKKVDITTIALEGAATGVAVMGLLFVLLRPR